MDTIAKQLGETGLCVYPDFLSPDSLRSTRADLDSLQDSGGLHRAGTGRGEQKGIHDQVRRDEIRWLDRADTHPVRIALMEKVDALRVAFNRTLFLGLNDFEGHYAIYPPGGFYRRHLDSFKSNGGNNPRRVSLVVYLNGEWKDSDGGELRVYEKDGSHINVSPVGGTMVCFMSQESEHEVLESHRTRSSFVGWFKCVGQ